MEVLTLRWNKYQNVFSYHLSELRKKAFFTDATIACNGKFYNVHKFVLSICSDYFSSIFIQTTCKNPVVIIKDVHCKDIEYLLDYMYTGEVNVRQSELASLILSAENLQIKGLAVSDKSYTSTFAKAEDSSKNDVTSNNFITEHSKSNAFVLKNNEISSDSSQASSDIYKRENLTKGHHANIGIGVRECPSPQKQLVLSKKISSTENFKSNRLDIIINETPPRKEESLLELPLHEEIKTELLDMPEPENCCSLQEDSFCQSECINYPKEVDSTNFFFQNSSDVYNQKELVSNNIIKDVLNSRDGSERKQRLSKVDKPESAFHFIVKSRNQESGNSHQSLYFENASDNPIKKNYKCSFCGRAFSYKTNQLAHERVHTGEKPFQCLYCPLRTSLKGNLKNHILTRHNMDWKSIKHLIFPLF